MRRSRGFTLLELLLTITMLMILGSVVGPVLGNIVHSATFVWARGDSLADARIAIERLVMELRLLPSISSLTSIGNSNLAFQYPAGTNLQYWLSGTNFQRNSNVLVSDVSALTFSYFDEQGSITSTLGNVRSIGIQISVLPPSGGEIMTLRTRVFLRNTGHNYDGFEML